MEVTNSAAGCCDHESQPCRLGSVGVLVRDRYRYLVAHLFTRRAIELGKTELIAVWQQCIADTNFSSILV